MRTPGVSVFCVAASLEGLVAAPARAGAALQKRPVLNVGIRGAGAESASGYRQSSGAKESIESWRR